MSLRGRGSEFKQVDGLISAIPRESRSLMVRGDPGIGKMPLLEYLVDSASHTTVVLLMTPSDL